MMETRTSTVLNLGGGNSALADLEHDLPLVDFCEEAGVSVVHVWTAPWVQRVCCMIRQAVR